ncbi:MAG TPA: WD40 repeat domain-containing protein, partial [Pyrinomonadaceae bacterium]
MRLPVVVLLTLICCSAILSQSKPVVEDKGNFGLHVVDDSIIQYKYLERENQLLVVGYKNLQLLDLTNFKVIETRPIDLPTRLRPYYNYTDWTISADGRRMVLVGLADAYTKTKQAARVLDLKTGKPIALLDHPDQIRTAWWSKNGKTLVTMDAPAINPLTKTLNVSFWDGETFEHRRSVTVENVTWIYLSNDGERFFAASGKEKNVLGIKYVADADSVVRIWRTATGELEKTIAVADAKFHPKTREIEISPDEKFLVMVNKHKSVPAENRLLAWRINGGINPIYELKPQPKIDDSRVVFSPDGNYFAVDVGKNLQIYETETGKLKVELTNVELPSWGWLNNDVLASVDFKSKNFFEMGKMLKAFDATDGRPLFTQRLAYAEPEVDHHSYDYYNQDGKVTDDTILRPHPNRKIFLTSSNEFVKIFDSRTGELLQTVVHPLIRVDLMGKIKMTHGKTVLSADWTKDGK